MTRLANNLLLEQGRPAPGRQAGYASLGIGVIVLFILALMTIYLSKSGILDLRSSADKVRYAQAVAQAELKVDEVFAWLSGKNGTTDNYKTLTTASWPLCNDAAINSALPLAVKDAATWQAAFDRDGDGTVEWACKCFDHATRAEAACTRSTVYLATPVANRGSVFYLISGGYSDCSDNTDPTTCTGRVIVKQGLYFFNPLLPGNSNGPAPLMGAGNIPLNGTFNVVANPNGGGPGVPVSVWSKLTAADPSGNSRTCQIQEYMRDGDCNGSPLSDAHGSPKKGVDFVDPSTSPTTVFPPDMFEYTFGTPTQYYDTIKSRAQPLTNCGTLNAASTGVYWYVGAGCDIPANTVVGSRAAPVVLIVESASFRMNANSTFYGMIFAFDPNGNTAGMTMNGGAKVYGSILSNDKVQMGLNINGTFDLVYDVPTMNVITDPNNNFFKFLARMPGSWADYL